MRATFKLAFSTVSLTVLVLYGVELLDELIYGLHGAVLPQLKSDLALTYTEIGLLTTIPGLVALACEPVIGLLGDTRYRRALIVSGISAAALGLFLTGIAQNLAVLILAATIGYSASGAYVNLAQATLIDRLPARAEQTMARWTLLGSVGVAGASMIVTAAFALGSSWRVLYIGLAAVVALYTALLWRVRLNGQVEGEERSISARELLRNLFAALRDVELLRWVVLTELADLMLDRLLEVTGLYFHDAVGVGLAEASGAVALLSVAWLVGGALVVPLLERVRGALWLRATAGAALLLYIVFLLAPFVPAKFVLIGAIALCTAGWFPILRGKTYAALPGQSGLIIAITALANVLNLFVPVVLGAFADAFGLAYAMWLLALGPVALLVGLPNK